MEGQRAAKVWMMAVDASAGCQPCPAPDGLLPPLRTSGPPAQVERVLQALRAVRNPDTGTDIVSEGWIGSLDLGADEALLGLWSRQPGCHAVRAIAEDAFAVLRSELPDTDLYVRQLEP